MQNGLHGFPGNTPVYNRLRKNAIGGVITSTHAALDIPLLQFAQYPFVNIEIMNLIPTTDGVDIGVRASIDGGATFDAGGSTYEFVQYGYYSGGGGAGAALGASSQTGSSILLATAASSKVSNVQSEGGFNSSIMFQQAVLPNWYVPQLRAESRFAAAANPGLNGITTHGWYINGNNKVTALRIIPSSNGIEFCRWWAWVPEWFTN